MKQCLLVCCAIIVCGALDLCARAGEFTLFGPIVSSENRCESLPLFGTVAVNDSAPDPMPLFSSVAVANAAAPTRAEADVSHIKGPVAICYSAPWCRLCRDNKAFVPAQCYDVAGVRYTVKHVSGITDADDPKSYAGYLPFNADVQTHGAEHGYPVWRVRQESGRWIFVSQTRSPDDLAKLLTLKRGEATPPSTFNAWAYKVWAANRRVGDAEFQPQIVGSADR